MINTHAPWHSHNTLDHKSFIENKFLLPNIIKCLKFVEYTRGDQFFFLFLPFSACKSHIDSWLVIHKLTFCCTNGRQDDYFFFSTLHKKKNFISARALPPSAQNEFYLKSIYSRDLNTFTAI